MDKARVPYIFQLLRVLQVQEAPPRLRRPACATQHELTRAMNQRVRDKLLTMKEHDLRVRARLADDGLLFEGYHAEMEAVHRRNAVRLVEIMNEFGWPGSSLVGEDGAEAAWLVAQHAIGEPALQRRCLALLQEAAETGEAPPYQAAYLEDRIRVFEGRKQRYGTQIDYGLDGTPRPYPIEGPDGVDERRREVGLEPLAQRIAKAEPIPPTDATKRAERQRERDAWLRRVGWRS